MIRYEVSNFTYVFDVVLIFTVDKLILTARQKLTVLIQAVSKMEVTPQVKINANIFYHNILARSMRENYKDEVVAEGGMSDFVYMYKYSYALALNKQSVIFNIQITNYTKNSEVGVVL